MTNSKRDQRKGEPGVEGYSGESGWLGIDTVGTITENKSKADRTECDDRSESE